MASSELEQQIEAAFNYRGDVRLVLRGGRTLEGFLFNRDFAPHKSVRSAPYLEMLLPAGKRVRHLISEVESVSLTGQDHAQV